jgi:hypothetical protein
MKRRESGNVAGLHDAEAPGHGGKPLLLLGDHDQSAAELSSENPR